MSISVSPKNNILSLFIPSLSALNFICSADSSPETYNTCPAFAILLQIWSINVDLPIPGSPPKSVNEPFTRPPPKTLSNSPKPVGIFIVSFASYVFNFCGVIFSYGLEDVPHAIAGIVFLNKKL